MQHGDRFFSWGGIQESMDQVPSDGLSIQIRSIFRSLGFKLLLVSGLALGDDDFVSSGGQCRRRTHRAGQGCNSGNQRSGRRPAGFLGPTLSIPYTIPAPYKGASAATGVYVVFPMRGDATAKIRTEERRRSLFKVPVYQADMKFDATFDLTAVPSAAPTGAELEWAHAGIVIGASDARGALADGTLTVNGKTSRRRLFRGFPQPSTRKCHRPQFLHKSKMVFGCGARHCAAKWVQRIREKLSGLLNDDAATPVAAGDSRG
jgi:hypothetical protein